VFPRKTQLQRCHGTASTFAFVLTTVEQIIAQSNYEQEALELLKKQSISHVKVFEPLFLIKMGLKQDMNRAFAYGGWQNFIDITEIGSHLLTRDTSRVRGRVTLSSCTISDMIKRSSSHARDSLSIWSRV
jgi:hypothetical protein